MPVLVRYCLEALWPPFLLSIGAVTFVLNLLFYLREFLEYLLNYQAGVVHSFLLLLYIQPSFLILAIPIGFLIAVLIVYGRLSADREAAAVESCGISVWVLIWPMVGLSILLSLFLVVFMDTILPWGNTSFLKLQYKVMAERSSVIVRERVFVTDFEGYVIYVGQKDDQKDLLKNVTVELLDPKGEPYRLVLAKEGKIRQDPNNYHIVLDLSDGVMQQLGTQREKEMGALFQMQFKTCGLDLSARKLPSGPLDLRNPRNISLKELAAQIHVEKSRNQDARYDELEFHKKISLPFSALAFALIGIPLGLLSRAGSFAGPFLAVIMVAIYQAFLLFGEEGGPRGLISPFMAMWLPNVILIGLGILLIYGLNQRRDFWGGLLRFRGLREKFKRSDPGFSASKLK